MNERVARSLKKNFGDVAKNTWFEEGFRMLVAFKRNRNLQDLLVHSKMRKRRPGRQWEAQRGRYLRAEGRGVSCRLPRRVPRNVKNCIYLIRCQKCRKGYVGETKNDINTRFKAHRYNVRVEVRRKGHITSHFGRHGECNMRVTGLEHNPNWGKRDRLRRERMWIKRLGTQFPKGLNLRRDGT
ncbi:MAG: GIY-YIG nuclease family protein [Aeromonas sp.]